MYKLRKIHLMENFDILAKISYIIYAFFCNFEDRTRKVKLPCIKKIKVNKTVCVV
jgi:hypothetical protein